MAANWQHDNQPPYTILKLIYRIFSILLAAAIFGVMFYGCFFLGVSRPVSARIVDIAEDTNSFTIVLLGTDELSKCLVKGVVGYRRKHEFDSQDKVFEVIDRWKPGQTVGIGIQHTAINQINRTPIEYISVSLEAESAEGKCGGAVNWPEK